MPSSTSNSERHLPQVPWLQILGLAVFIFIVAVVALEKRLSWLGYQPVASDSSTRWLKERARASELGERALILVGASRIQLGLDLDVLRARTGLEPVQLAIDGSAFTPILEGLANDPTIRGTILVDYYDHAVGARGGAAENMQRRYEETGGFRWYLAQPAETIEDQLTQWVKEHLSAYADGANPMTSLYWRSIPGNKAQQQYLVTRPDRSRFADYSLVTMPDFYFQRVARTLGEDLDPRSPGIGVELARKISAISPMDNSAFLHEARSINHMVSKIRSHGGNVVFVAMPSSGMVRAIENRRYPRELFWDRFINESSATGIHSAYEPRLKEFVCPDGSHLDARDQARFTHRLVDVIGQGRQGQFPNFGRSK